MCFCWIFFDDTLSLSHKSPLSRRYILLLLLSLRFIITYVRKYYCTYYILLLYFGLWTLSTLWLEELEGYVRVLSGPYRKHTRRVCFNDWKKKYYTESRIRAYCCECTLPTVNTLRETGKGGVHIIISTEESTYI